MIATAIREFALDPPAYLPAREGALVVDDGRFHLVVQPDGTYASVSRIRTDDVAAMFAEVRRRAPDARVVWVADRSYDSELRRLGCRDQDPPITSYITALATESAPPEVPGVEVRRVETYDEFLVALRVSDRGWGSPPTTDPDSVWRRHLDRDGGDWLAFVDGEPAAYGGAVAGARGLFLTGGVTAPEFRGRGAYRALVRARWDEAVRRGTPALAVHAEEASRRVLVRIGFEEVGPIVELVS